MVNGSKLGFQDLEVMPATSPPVMRFTGPSGPPPPRPLPFLPPPAGCNGVVGAIGP